MRTLYLRIFIALLVTFVLSLLTVFWISDRVMQATMGEFFAGSMNLELQQARRIYEEGGPQQLAAYLNEVDGALRGQRFLTDSNGTDLVSGTDLSAMSHVETDFLGMPREVNGRVGITKASSDSRYRLIAIAPPPLSLRRFVPYFLLVSVAIGLVGFGLAVGIVSPLRRVGLVVDRFGRGHLSARVRSERKDEIGNLARSFNSMADRIETLLLAERKLLQDISHELRSPLARLSFAAELMKNAPDPEAAANRMKREISRLTRLVGALLEVTSAEGDPSSRKTQRFAFARVVNETVMDCSFEAEARGSKIARDCCSSATVEGDPELLRRALENVLRNAIRYAPSGSAIDLRVGDLGDRVQIVIRDHGPGVPEDMLQRIFDPFVRLNESRDTATEAVGLGLAIARRAVVLHQGEITAENACPGLRVTMLIPSISSTEAGLDPSS
jgi:signal transduction histidine kinase